MTVEVGGSPHRIVEYRHVKVDMKFGVRTGVCHIWYIDDIRQI